MSEGLLKGSLYDILGVFSRAGNAPHDEENHSLVTSDQNIERLPIAILRGSNKCHVLRTSVRDFSLNHGERLTLGRNASRGPKCAKWGADPLS
jgi:hypothetical protein